MLDQADDLRRMATARLRPQTKTVRPAGRPTLLAMTGGKGGVGTTTAAISLAVSLSRIGKRAIVIDADPRGGDVALRCGVEEPYTLADLLAGRQTWSEVIATAPKGVQLVAGARWSDELGNRRPAVAELLIELLDNAALQTDVAVIDVGNNPGRAGQRLCQAADAVVMVTTCETTAVMNTFAAIKRLGYDAAQSPSAVKSSSTQPRAAVPQALHLWVNMARSAHDAESVRRRLGRACRRLLGINLLGMDVSGSDLAVLSTAALFARFPQQRPSSLCRSGYA